MSKDISLILREWEFGPDPKTVRRFIGLDGREKIQRRIELGILQLEVEGRPDGKHPQGYPSLYDWYKHRAKEEKRSGVSGELKLTARDCQALQAEALLYYQRRLCFFELEDYTGAARDARRNLEVFAFVREHADREEDKMSLDQYRAFVIFHRSKAEVLGCLERKEYDFALRYIENAEEEIRQFFVEYHRPELSENSEELKQLVQWREQIEKMRPLSRRQILEQELKEAVEREEYERAAQIRDEIQRQSGDPR
ncbi:MAG: UvrB/UvrC motif-containing protein [Planctomycetes bacterium]|nr:UvrB/UvrC motif-containing protein [Planctomycetota bacterium]